jgi:hypothetical protein
MRTGDRRHNVAVHKFIESVAAKTRKAVGTPGDLELLEHFQAKPAPGLDPG